MAKSDLGFWSFAVLQAAVGVLFAGVIFFWPGAWDSQRKLGALIAFTALVLLGVSRYQLGKSFSVTPRARALVTHGIYARIRNPIYVFSTIMIAGLILVLHRPKMWGLLAILIVIQILRARREAQVLEQKFGDSYRVYRRKTWF